MKGVVGLAKGLRKVKTAYPLVVAVLPDMLEEHHRMLVEQGCIVREIEPVYPPENQTQFAMAYYIINYSKLRIWELIDLTAEKESRARMVSMNAAQREWRNQRRRKLYAAAKRLRERKEDPVFCVFLRIDSTCTIDQLLMLMNYVLYLVLNLSMTLQRIWICNKKHEETLRCNIKVEVTDPMGIITANVFDDVAESIFSCTETQLVDFTDNFKNNTILKIHSSENRHDESMPKRYVIYHAKLIEHLFIEPVTSNEDKNLKSSPKEYQEKRLKAIHTSTEETSKV
ncbi:hypothetical protein L1049_004117 [Liquidambar formosana]|uniref:Uncharacterized protein n=1 Tax=Liquidambar formosana TaxID=63359 RepID=A0AAP0RRK4_LIQFO